MKHTIGIRLLLLIAFGSCFFSLYAAFSPVYTMNWLERFICALCFVLPICISGFLLGNKHPAYQNKIYTFIWIILCLYYVFSIIYLLFFATELSRDIQLPITNDYITNLTAQWDTRTNLIPFHTIQLMLHAYKLGYIELAGLNIIGNIVVFMPFALFLPKFFHSLRKNSTFFLTMAVIICIIEIMQLLTLKGTLDIDDFILNMLGLIIIQIIIKRPIIQTFLMTYVNY